MLIEIPLLPPGEMSPNWRGHWSVRSPASAAFREAVRLCAISQRNLAKMWVPFARPVIDLTFIFDVERNRDEDNLRARFKPGLDGLVDAELLLDDSSKRLITGTITILIDKERSPMTIIELREMANE